MSTVGPIFCYDGRPVKVKLGDREDSPDCETWSNPFDCSSEGSVVVIECVDDDPKSPWKCGAREVHEECLGWGDMTSFCPARSTELGRSTSFHESKYTCGGGAVLASSYSAGLDASTKCPLCGCDAGTECVGRDCDACGGAVSRSADVACVPRAWANLAPPDVPVATPAPAPSPRAATDDDDDDAPFMAGGTLAPTALADRSTGASSAAAILIALIAGGITACAIRQAVVKRRKREAAGGSTYVDIPHRSPGALFAVAPPVGNPLSAARGYDEIADRGPADQEL